MTCCSFSYFSLKTKSADSFLINARINGVVEFMAEATGLFMLVKFIMTSWFRRFLDWVVMFSNISRNVQLDRWFVVPRDSSLQCNAVSSFKCEWFTSMLWDKLRYSIIKLSTESLVYYYISLRSHFVLVRLSFHYKLWRVQIMFCNIQPSMFLLSTCHYITKYNQLYIHVM
jgi:hypothetical protein